MWELEVSYEGETDLERCSNCKKNPGHLNFIPVHEFSVEKLPSAYHDNDLVDLVQAMAELTIRLSVGCVSKNRQPLFPGSDKPDPFYKYRGKKVTTLGTGWVNEVEISSKNSDCKCQECLVSPTPRKQFANIIIRTAAHVIYDDIEAAVTTCLLFFDSVADPLPTNGVVALSGMSRVRNNHSIDFCEIVYLTHNIELADRLNKTLETWNELRETINLKNRRSSTFEDQMYSPGEEEPESVHKLTVIVSHPHGCSKQVSIGEWMEKTNQDDEWVKYSYNTATCSGSSGAHVLLFGREWMNWWVKFNHVGVAKGRNESNVMLDG